MRPAAYVNLLNFEFEKTYEKEPDSFFFINLENMSN